VDGIVRRERIRARNRVRAHAGCRRENVTDLRERLWLGEDVAAETDAQHVGLKDAVELERRVDARDARDLLGRLEDVDFVAEHGRER